MEDVLAALLLLSPIPATILNACAYYAQAEATDRRLGGNSKRMNASFAWGMGIFCGIVWPIGIPMTFFFTTMWEHGLKWPRTK